MDSPCNKIQMLYIIEMSKVLMDDRSIKKNYKNIKVIILQNAANHSLML